MKIEFTVTIHEQSDYAAEMEVPDDLPADKIKEYVCNHCDEIEIDWNDGFNWQKECPEPEDVH